MRVMTHRYAEQQGRPTHAPSLQTPSRCILMPLTATAKAQQRLFCSHPHPLLPAQWLKTLSLERQKSTKQSLKSADDLKTIITYIKIKYRMFFLLLMWSWSQRSWLHSDTIRPAAPGCHLWTCPCQGHYRVCQLFSSSCHVTHGPLPVATARLPELKGEDGWEIPPPFGQFIPFIAN